MPTQVKRGNTVEYSIPDKIDRTKDNIVAKDTINTLYYNLRGISEKM